MKMADEIMTALSKITDQQIIDGLRCSAAPGGTPDGMDCDRCPFKIADELDGEELICCDVDGMAKAAADRLEALSKGLHGIMAQLKKEQQRTVTAGPEQVYIGRRLGHAQ